MNKYIYKGLSKLNNNNTNHSNIPVVLDGRQRFHKANQRPILGIHSSLYRRVAASRAALQQVPWVSTQISHSPISSHTTTLEYKKGRYRKMQHHSYYHFYYHSNNYYHQHYYLRCWDTLECLWFGLLHRNFIFAGILCSVCNLNFLLWEPVLVRISNHTHGDCCFGIGEFIICDEFNWCLIWLWTCCVRLEEQNWT